MAKKAVTKKPRNPNDATFRNVTALKGRVRDLSVSVRALVSSVIDLDTRLAQLEKRR